MRLKTRILGSCNLEIPIQIKFHFLSIYEITYPVYALKTTHVLSHLALPI